MKKICVSSSYDDRGKMIEVVNGMLESSECIVLYPQFLDRRPTEKEKISLMRSHFFKMSVSEYFVFVFDTKFGTNTLMELGYALNLAERKRIVALLNKEQEIPDEIACGTVKIYNKVVDAVEYIKSIW